VLMGGWEKSMPNHPHAVLENCTLVHPDNAVALSYASHCARVRFVGCRMIVLNFTQPEMGAKSTGIICTQGHLATGRLHVDLEDCIMAGYSIFTPGPDAEAVSFTTRERSRPMSSSSSPYPKDSDGWDSGPSTFFPKWPLLPAQTSLSANRPEDNSRFGYY